MLLHPTWHYARKRFTAKKKKKDPKPGCRCSIVVAASIAAELPAITCRSESWREHLRSKPVHEARQPRGYSRTEESFLDNTFIRFLFIVITFF